MLGDKIRELRKRKKMTMKSLGQVISVGESTISLYENNKRTPDYEKLKKIANHFNISLEYLLDFKPSKQKIEINNFDDLSEYFVMHSDEDERMKKIKELREKYKLSQKEFGVKLGVAQNTISNWEQGIRLPDYESLKKIADYFNVSLDYLLDYGILRKKDWIEKNRKNINKLVAQIFDDLSKYFDIQSETGKTRTELMESFLSADIDTFIVALSKMFRDISYDEKNNKYTVFFIDDGFKEENIDTEFDDEIYYLDEGDKFLSKYPPKARKEIEAFLDYIDHKYGFKK